MMLMEWARNCIVQLSRVVNERAYMAPDDTIFNAPLGDSLSSISLIAPLLAGLNH